MTWHIQHTCQSVSSQCISHLQVTIKAAHQTPNDGFSITIIIHILKCTEFFVICSVCHSSLIWIIFSLIVIEMLLRCWSHKVDMSDAPHSLTSPVTSPIIWATWSCYQACSQTDKLSINSFLHFYGKLFSRVILSPGISRSVCHIQQMVKSLMVMGTQMQMTDKKCPYYWILRLHSTIPYTFAEKIMNKMFHFQHFLPCTFP